VWRRAFYAGMPPAMLEALAAGAPGMHAMLAPGAPGMLPPLAYPDTLCEQRVERIMHQQYNSPTARCETMCACVS
jgi:hypothetical protein